MDYAPAELEQRILVQKTGVHSDIAQRLVGFAQEIRKAKTTDAIQLSEGASTRLLVFASEFYQEASFGFIVGIISRRV